MSIFMPIFNFIAVTTGDSVNESCLALRLHRPRGVFGTDVY